jgi:hypothetical protein
MLNDLSSFSSAIMSSRMDAEWSYDQRSGRYRDEKGRFLSKASVGKLVDGRIDKLETQLKRFTRMLGDGSITLDQWQGSVREAIKAAHIQAATIGYGGRSEMGSAEYGRIGQRLRAEYTYLQGFVRDLLDGRVSAPMAVARIGLVCSIGAWLLLARHGNARTAAWIFVDAPHPWMLKPCIAKIAWAMQHVASCPLAAFLCLACVVHVEHAANAP